MLTEREKWLMRQAYVAGCIAGKVGLSRDFDEWLGNITRGGGSVEEYLLGKAPDDVEVTGDDIDKLLRTAEIIDRQMTRLEKLREN